MAHAIEGNKMAFVGETPWHGLGVKVDESMGYDVPGFIAASGLNSTVGLKPLFLGEEDGVDDKNEPKYRLGSAAPAFMTYRIEDGQTYGVVGPRYTPLQNVDAFNWFQPFLDKKECCLHTAGSLFDGAKIWILAKLNRDPSEIVKEDIVEKYILLSNSHDGTTAIRTGYTPIRVVCANTLAAAHYSNESKLIRVRHTASAQVNLDKVRDVMNNIDAEFNATAEQYRFLASRNFNQDDVKKYVKLIVGVNELKEDDISTRSKNIMADMLERIFDGPKQQLAGVSGTWWAAYNGVNEYYNYKAGRNNENRLNNLWFGAGVADNRAALELAVNLANAA
jgi:phage/plasmid-like protein (TIGR03299 family)